MNRIAPEDVVAHYRQNPGIRPIAGRWRLVHRGKRYCCALTILNLLDGGQFPDFIDDDLLMDPEGRRLEPDYARGFRESWDQDPYCDDLEGQEEEFAKYPRGQELLSQYRQGIRDGKEAYGAVESAGLKIVNAEDLLRKKPRKKKHKGE